MGQYTATSFAASSTISASLNAGINQELRNIALAHNLHASTDITVTGSVSNNMLICPRSHFTMTLRSATTIAGAKTTGDIAAYCVVPLACRVEWASFYVLSPAATSGSGMYVYKEGSPDQLVFYRPEADVKSGAYVYSMLGPFVTDFAAGDVLTLRVVVAGGENSLWHFVMLHAKAFHD